MPEEYTTYKYKAIEFPVDAEGVAWFTSQQIAAIIGAGTSATRSLIAEALKKRQTVAGAVPLQKQIDNQDHYNLAILLWVGLHPQNSKRSHQVAKFYSWLQVQLLLYDTNHL